VAAAEGRLAALPPVNYLGEVQRQVAEAEAAVTRRIRNARLQLRGFETRLGRAEGAVQKAADEAAAAAAAAAAADTVTVPRADLEARAAEIEGLKAGLAQVLQRCAETQTALEACEADRVRLRAEAAQWQQRGAEAEAAVTVEREAAMGSAVAAAEASESVQAVEAQLQEAARRSARREDAVRVRLHRLSQTLQQREALNAEILAAAAEDKRAAEAEAQAARAALADLRRARVPEAVRDQLTQVLVRADDIGRRIERASGACGDVAAKADAFQRPFAHMLYRAQVSAAGSNPATASATASASANATAAEGTSESGRFFGGAAAMPTSMGAGGQMLVPLANWFPRVLTDLKAAASVAQEAAAKGQDMVGELRALVEAVRGCTEKAATEAANEAERGATEVGSPSATARVAATATAVSNRFSRDVQRAADQRRSNGDSLKPLDRSVSAGLSLALVDALDSLRAPARALERTTSSTAQRRTLSATVRSAGPATAGMMGHFSSSGVPEAGPTEAGLERRDLDFYGDASYLDTTALSSFGDTRATFRPQSSNVAATAPLPFMDGALFPDTDDALSMVEALAAAIEGSDSRGAARAGSRLVADSVRSVTLSTSAPSQQDVGPVSPSKPEPIAPVQGHVAASTTAVLASSPFPSAPPALNGSAEPGFVAASIAAARTAFSHHPAAARSASASRTRPAEARALQYPQQHQLLHSRSASVTPSSAARSAALDVYTEAMRGRRVSNPFSASLRR
jgi:hypothetical protein